MKPYLTVHDVSGYVYTGMSHPDYVNYSVQGFPMGGVKYFLKYLTPHLVGNTEVVCVFDGPGNFRKEIMPEYKVARGEQSAHKYSIYAQLEYLYKMLSACNIACYKVPEMEGDDVVFNAVESLKGEYHRVSVFSSDYDLTHNVDVSVDFQAVNSNVNNVNLKNFKNAVVRNKEILINTISAYHALCGCNSDGIPPFVSENGIKGKDLYDRYCAFLKARYVPYDEKALAISRDPRALKIFLGSIKEELTDADIQKLLVHIAVAYPKRDESLQFFPTNRAGLNEEKYTRLLSVTRNFSGIKQLKLYLCEISEEEISDFRKRANELKTGEYAADRGLPVDPVKDQSRSLSYLREF